MFDSFPNIMLIDDDKDDQEIFLSALEMISDTIACTTANNGQDAFDQLSAKPIGTDLIFLDLNMPIMNGEEFLERLRDTKELSHIPVIVLSTSAQKETIQLTKQLGAKDFITKPVDFQEFIAILKSSLYQ